jgi:hypothetical protein
MRVFIQKEKMTTDEKAPTSIPLLGRKFKRALLMLNFPLALLQKL